ncbi:glycosyltransferase [Mycoplasmatota bacterium WC44]
MKPKMLFIAPNMYPGGAESVLVKLLNNIDRDKYDIKLVLIKMEGHHLSKLPDNLEIIDLKCKKSILAIPRIRKVILKEKPDFIFSIIGQVNLILAILKMIFFKNICFIGRENAVYNEWLYKDINFKKRILSILYHFLLKKLDYIVVQSQFMEKQVIDYFKVPKNKVVIINNPIEHNTIKLLMEDNIKNDMWKFDRVNLLAVGRIEKVKNYFDMVDIIKMLPERFHLNILGDGTERLNLEKYIEIKGLNHRITLYGYVDNPYKYMRNSFALLLTSTRESFPNVVIEASACGLYVVSYNMPGGISEIIKNGINGSIVPQGQKDKFVIHLTKLLESGYDSKEIIENSKKYSIDIYMEKMYVLFRD